MRIRTGASNKREKELVDAEKGLVIVRVEVGIDMPNTAQENVPNNSQSHMKIVLFSGLSVRKIAHFAGTIRNKFVQMQKTCWRVSDIAE